MTLDTDTDDELVQRARDGDPVALDLLVDRHHAAAFRVARAILGDHERAADATQDAMLRALRSLAGFRGDSSFRTWLCRIVSNQAKTALRRETLRAAASPEAVLALSDPRPGADERVAHAEEDERVRAALSTLPPKQRMAVSLRIYDGLSFREVGDVIESSEGAARVNYHHGIKKLRELLK